LLRRLRSVWRRARPGDASHEVAPLPRRDDLETVVMAPRVLVLNFDPVIEAEGGRRLNAVLGFNEPGRLADEYAADLVECSGGCVRYRVVEWLDLDEHPVKIDGFRYTDAGLVAAWRAGGPFHEPDGLDYRWLIERFGLARRVDAGEADEVWVFAYPYAGLWESTMAGPGAVWCNSPPVEGADVCRRFVIMGLNPERGVGEMLENFGHRVESLLTHAYGSWQPDRPRHAWDHFTRYDLVAPGASGCGTVHHAPNSTADYDWGNPRPVLAAADDWLNYPYLTGRRRMMSARDWGHGDTRAHHRWWLRHLPKAPGRGPDGKLANWWRYAVDLSPQPPPL